MSKALKYQTLIDSLSLSIQCPDNCSPIEKDPYRWVKEDFSDGQSFLPNYIYDQNRGRPPRRNDPSDVKKCGMCALSFFDSIEAANMNAEAIGGPSRVKKLLGYTHIAYGKLKFDDGLASSSNEHGHFIFFEFVGVFLEPHFTILQQL